MQISKSKLYDIVKEAIDNQDSACGQLATDECKRLHDLKSSKQKLKYTYRGEEKKGVIIGLKPIADWKIFPSELQVKIAFGRGQRQFDLFDAKKFLNIYTVASSDDQGHERWMPKSSADEEFLSSSDLTEVPPSKETPPKLPIQALAQRKDIIVLPKSTVKLKNILNDLIDNAMKYADNQDPEVGDALGKSGADPHAGYRFRDSIVMSVLRDLRNLNVGQYLKESINDFIYIKESTLEKILTNILQKKE